MILSILTSVAALSGLGASVGLLLALADKKLAVEENPLIDEVEAVLPSGQCGNCGFAGCRQYAEMVVNNPDVTADLCTPGGAEVAAKIAEITGKDAGNVQAVKAVPQCKGCTDENCRGKYIYEGLVDCVAAAQLFAGMKLCEFGCLGLGNCERACPFDAIHITDAGLPEVNVDKCVGCGLCMQACPKDIISLVPVSAASVIKCKNHDKGGVTKKACTVGCLGCRLCEKACPHGAMKVQDNLCVIDYEKCEKCQELSCLMVQCKTGVIEPNYGVEAPHMQKELL